MKQSELNFINRFYEHRLKSLTLQGIWQKNIDACAASAPYMMARLIYARVFGRDMLPVGNRAIPGHDLSVGAGVYVGGMMY